MKLKKFSVCLLFALSFFALVSCTNDDKGEAGALTSIDQKSVRTESIIDLAYRLLTLI